MKKKKKLTATSKKDTRKGDRHNPKIVTLSDGSKVMESYHKHFMAKTAFMPPKKDYEKLSPPDDEISKHQYPPPKNHPKFREMWAKFIDSVLHRKNFKEGHLDSLKVLCDLYVEYEELNEFLRVNGNVYLVINRFGQTRKNHPEVAQLERVRVNILAYTKMLDLFPKKDTTVAKGGAPSSEWS